MSPPGKPPVRTVGPVVGLCSDIVMRLKIGVDEVALHSKNKDRKEQTSWPSYRQLDFLISVPQVATH